MTWDEWGGEGGSPKPSPPHSLNHHTVRVVCSRASLSIVKDVHSSHLSVSVEGSGAVCICRCPSSAIAAGTMTVGKRSNHEKVTAVGI